MQATIATTNFSQTLVASAVSITTATDTNILAAPMVCAPGTWLFLPCINFIFPASTSYTVLSIGVNTTSATLPTSDLGLWKQTVAVAVVPGAPQSWLGNPFPLTFSIATSVYLVARATFTASTLTASGWLLAVQVSP